MRLSSFIIAVLTSQLAIAEDWSKFLSQSDYCSLSAGEAQARHTDSTISQSDSTSQSIGNIEENSRRADEGLADISDDLKRLFEDGHYQQYLKLLQSKDSPPLISASQITTEGVQQVAAWMSIKKICGQTMYQPPEFISTVLALDFSDHYHSDLAELIERYAPLTPELIYEELNDTLSKIHSIQPPNFIVDDSLPEYLAKMLLHRLGELELRVAPNPGGDPALPAVTLTTNATKQPPVGINITISKKFPTGWSMDFQNELADIQQELSLAHSSISVIDFTGNWPDEVGAYAYFRFLQLSEFDDVLQNSDARASLLSSDAFLIIGHAWQTIYINSHLRVLQSQQPNALTLLHAATARPIEPTVYGTSLLTREPLRRADKIDMSNILLYESKRYLTSHYQALPNGKVSAFIDDIIEFSILTSLGVSFDTRPFNGRTGLYTVSEFTVQRSLEWSKLF